MLFMKDFVSSTMVMLMMDLVSFDTKSNQMHRYCSLGR